MQIVIQQIYDPVSYAGYRVLVDRLWPRGISKKAACLDDWWKDLTPSTELRKWFHEASGREVAFQEQYLAELQSKMSLAKDLLGDVKETLVLVTAKKTESASHADVLKRFLESITEDRGGCASPPCYDGDGF